MKGMSFKVYRSTVAEERLIARIDEKSIRIKHTTTTTTTTVVEHSDKKKKTTRK
jgi:hypothetical protein